MTITLDLPDELAASLAALPDATRNEFATTVLAGALAALAAGPVWTAAKEKRTSPDDELSEEEAKQIAEGVKRSLAAEAEGRFRPAAEAFADLNARLGISSAVQPAARP